MAGPIKKRKPSRGKPKPKFVQSRLREEEEPFDQQDDTHLEEDEENVFSESESEQDEKEIRPYNNLLEVFHVKLGSSDHVRKRRRLGNNLTSKKTTEILKDEDDDVSDEQKSNDEDGFENEDEDEDIQSDLDTQNFEDDSDNDHSDSQHDLYQKHFSSMTSQDLESRINSIESKEWVQQKVKSSTDFICNRFVPKELSTEKYSWSVSNTQSLIETNLKSRLKSNIQLLNQISEIDESIISALFSYQDILYTGRTPKNGSTLRSLSTLHALNHIFKTRSKVLKHNSIMSSQKLQDGSDYRDQGFTRPRVLYILPNRKSCSEVVKTIVSICTPEQQENRKRFDESFTNHTNNISEDRPEDYKELFDGDDDDMFRIGIKFTRKSLKLFSQFYSSDIIIASPLGLRNAIESGSKKKQQDYDFLSSIEVLIIDQADSLLMQNWDHVKFVLSHLNLSPLDPHGCDFSRVRPWYLDDQAKYLRQTILVSAFLTPDLNSLFNSSMLNVAGKVKSVLMHSGAILSTGLRLRQTFSRFPSPTLKNDPDTRFAYFTSTIVPWIMRQPRPSDGNLGLLIFIPSYFDFVRVRNYFSTNSVLSSVSFGVLSENNTPAEPEVRRARSHFLTGKHSVLLYSGRAHHFYRYAIKGVKNVVVYQVPDNPLFYKETVGGFIGETVQKGIMNAEEGRVRVMFSKWDIFALERIVGTERIGSMLGGKGDVFDFV